MLQPDGEGPSPSMPDRHDDRRSFGAIGALLLVAVLVGLAILYLRGERLTGREPAALPPPLADRPGASVPGP